MTRFTTLRRKLLSLLLLALISGSLLGGPSAEDLQKMAEAEHEELTVGELKKYWPKVWPKWEGVSTIHLPDGQKVPGDPIRGTQKFVGGKWVVTVFRLPNAKGDTISAITWDEAAGCFRRWAYVTLPAAQEAQAEDVPAPFMVEAVGIPVPGPQKPTLAWNMMMKSEMELGFAVYEEGSTSSIMSRFIKGEFRHRMELTAKPIED